MTITLIRQEPSAADAHIRHTQPNVTLHVTPPSKLIQNPGTLYIADEYATSFVPKLPTLVFVLLAIAAYQLLFSFSFSFSLSP